MAHNSTNVRAVKKTVPVLGKRNAAHVHPEQPRHQVERHRQHGDHREHEQDPVVLLVDDGGQFLLQQPDALHQGSGIGHGGGELFG